MHHVRYRVSGQDFVPRKGGFCISMRHSYFENNECFGVWPKYNP